jgi:hypothetical protein
VSQKQKYCPKYECIIQEENYIRIEIKTIFEARVNLGFGCLKSAGKVQAYVLRICIQTNKNIIEVRGSSFCKNLSIRQI